MLALIIWISIGFLSGSVPWALLIGKTLVGKDIRSVGDGNPGSANLWMLGGWAPGVLSLILEVSKGLLPVCVAFSYFGQPSDFTPQWGLALVTLAPVVGHGWSPFLHFKGGKSLAVSWGSWIAITGGVAFPVALILLGAIHGLQKNHAITVTFCLIGFLAVFFPLEMQPYIALFWVGNMMIIIFKHRSEYADGLIVRSWALRLARALT